MAPFAVNVELFPLHNKVGVPEAVIVGVGVTVILTIAVDVQTPFEPVTVYVVLFNGVTTTLDPINALGFQVYDVAPVADKVVELPEQIVLAEAVALMVGKGTTETVVVTDAVQPDELLPDKV